MTRDEGGPDPKPSDHWRLRLYVAGSTPTSRRALENLRRICEEHLDGRYHLEVIDLLETPHLASEHQILALPTLVKEVPPPMRKVIGDLSATAKVLVGLDLRPTEE